MGVKPDSWIREQAMAGMIEPFVDRQVGEEDGRRAGNLELVEEMSVLDGKHDRGDIVNEKSGVTVFRLDQFVKGWVIGDFSPAAVRTSAVEVAVKRYVAGDREEKHVHRVATEVTVVVVGRVIMCGRVCDAGDVLVLRPGEATDFEASTDAVTVVVKMPSVPGDKYVV